MTSYRPACSTPCGECPFRRKSAAGWLGAATPESFIVEISMGRPLPCHMTLDYEDDDWQEQWREQRAGLICAGSLTLSANMAKMPRDPAFPRKQPDRVNVFATPYEFINHHREAPVRSWELGDDAEREVRPRAEDTKATAAGPGRPAATAIVRPRRETEQSPVRGRRRAARR